MRVFLQERNHRCDAPLTTRMPGLKKYQHAFHHNQKTKLLFPTIISISLMKRFAPGAAGKHGNVDENPRGTRKCFPILHIVGIYKHS